MIGKQQHQFLERRHRAGPDQQAATIVNFNTPSWLLPPGANPLYSTTKAGLHIFTLVLRRQLQSTPVKVLEVFPPALDTNLPSSLDDTDSGSSVKAANAAGIPLHVLDIAGDENLQATGRLA